MQEVRETPPLKSEKFAASKGWFDPFRKRDLHYIQCTGDAASADHEAAKRFPQELQTIIEDAMLIATETTESLKPTMNAAWKNICPQCVRQCFANIALPEVNTNQLINIGRQIGGKGFEHLDDSDILEVLHADDTELTIAPEL
ncbi:hypothetical protein QE152_g10778 [Popillia japonica]|uniref:HTH CENPB-type domain-containing protein n=1 Tax=Popillia japonica TaxID=7064 RepID=A0AAW1LTU8_POPJA